LVPSGRETARKWKPSERFSASPSLSEGANPKPESGRKRVAEFAFCSGVSCTYFRGPGAGEIAEELPERQEYKFSWSLIRVKSDEIIDGRGRIST
jgi:hypothetical protein